MRDQLRALLLSCPLCEVLFNQNASLLLENDWDVLTDEQIDAIYELLAEKHRTEHVQ